MNEFDEILEGLTKNPKSISSKYFYDSEGSKLFDEITKLDEYYIARCEKEILYTQANVFLSLSDSRPIELIELGPGDGSKAALLIEAFLRTNKLSAFHAVDISPRELNKLTHNLFSKFPTLKLMTVVADYTEGISKISSLHPEHQNIVLFLGSSIGNMSPGEAHLFVKTLAAQLKPEDYLIIGFDLKKEERILWRAYNDTRGLTAEFNLNLLNRINKEFGADFDISRFKHFEVYNPEFSVMESYLISLEKQTVTFEESEFEIAFDRDEMIHTESSFKFDKKTILSIVKDTGLTAEHFLFDKKNYVTIGIFKVLNRH
ncbi:MAG: L-histidine N(alpha)-methyltransferase [Pseudobdellovibrionaceae bacterium]